MDAVTRANLRDFVQRNQIVAADTDKQFEYMTAYCIMGPALEDSLDLDQVVVGEGGDCGLDSIAIIVNGVHVTDPQQVQDILDNNKYLDAQFIFVQSTSSSEFDGGKINTFFFGVEDFLRENPSLPANDKIVVARQIKDELYSRAASFKRGNPDLFCHYVTTGNWQEPEHTVAIISAFKNRLEATNMLDAIHVNMVDARELQRLYRSAQNSLKAEVTIPSILTMPPIEGVDQSYIGYIQAPEYMKLITDEYGNIRKAIFYDNVRDFQGENKVNAKISATLASERKSEFVIRNNGITVVAKALTRTGNLFALTDYQIVNGCQTSHVLFMNSDKLDETVLVPIRIIATENEDATKSIIEATNSQTEVSDEQLRSLSDFQKTLEDYYATFDGDQRIFYERRSKQYLNFPGIEKTRIISIPYQIKSYAAMFLEDPHRAGRYFATLRKIHEDRLFRADDKPEPYYTAAYSAYRLEYLFRNSLLPSEYRAVRYHLLMTVRAIVGETMAIPRANSRDMVRLCTKINETMWDAVAAQEAFEISAGLVHEALLGIGRDVDRDVARSQDSTDAILSSLRRLLSD